MLKRISKVQRARKFQDTQLFTLAVSSRLLETSWVLIKSHTDKVCPLSAANAIIPLFHLSDATAIFVYYLVATELNRHQPYM